MRSPSSVLAAILVLSTLLPRCGGSRTEAVTDLPEFNGRSLRWVTGELGPPDRTLRYAIADAPTKDWHHGILFSAYPRTDPKNRSVEIRELAWEDGDHLIRICFHKQGDSWVVLGAKRIHRDVMF